MINKIEQLILKKIRANPRNGSQFMSSHLGRRLWVLEATGGECDPYATAYKDSHLCVQWHKADEVVDIFETEGFCVGKDNLNAFMRGVNFSWSALDTQDCFDRNFFGRNT